MSQRKKFKIKWADSTVLDALTPYVDEILECLAEALDMPGGLKNSFISDMSTISNFLDSVPTGKQVPHPLDRREPNPRMIDCVTVDTPENQALMKEISKKLGVSVDVHDYLYDVALRLRDKDGPS